MNNLAITQLNLSIATPTPDAPSFVPDRRIVPDVVLFRKKAAYSWLQRCIDIAGSALLLAVAAPIVAAAAVAIVAEDGGPVIFRQRRVGRFGRLFTIYKLRTMRKDKCADGLSPTSGRDPRVTRIGYWLRKLSIDELPQLVNILRGEMTFVGPRPEMPFLVRNYRSWQHMRHLVKPGVTGLWQVTCRSTVPLHLPEATMLDLQYIRSASLATDAKVMLRTVRQILSTDGAF